MHNISSRVGVYCILSVSYESECKVLQFLVHTLTRYCVPKNLLMTDGDVITSELKLYRQAGGKTVVDVATKGMYACREKLPKISQDSGVQIICGTGFYVDCCVPDSVKAMNEREMVDHMIKEITVGVEGTTAKAGVIGEVGCSWPLTDLEKIRLRAAAICQKETGVA